MDEIINSTSTPIKVSDPQQNTSDKSNKKRSCLIGFIIIVILLLLISCTGLFLLNRFNSLNNKPIEDINNSATDNDDPIDQTDDQLDDEKLLTHIDPHFDFEMDYPADWIVYSNYVQNCDPNYPEDLPEGRCEQLLFYSPEEDFRVVITVTDPSDYGYYGKPKYDVLQITNTSEVVDFGNEDSVKLTKFNLLKDNKIKEILYQKSLEEDQFEYKSLLFTAYITDIRNSDELDSVDLTQSNVIDIAEKIFKSTRIK